MHSTDFTPCFLPRACIDDLAWDALIARSRQCVIYAFTFYLDHVCQTWEALVWPAGDYQLVVPLPIRSKAGFRILYQPLLCQYLGIFSDRLISPAIAEEILRAVIRRYRYISCYNFNPSNHLLFQTGMPGSTMLFTQYLRVPVHEDELVNGYSTDRRRQLRRSWGQEWELVPGGQIHALTRLFHVYHAGQISGGVNPAAYKTLDRLVSCLQQKGYAEIWYAAKGGQVHAGIVVVQYQHQAVYLFNAADEHGRRGHARTFLLHEYLKMHRGVVRTFDFESPPVASIKAFYAEFGAVEVPFLSISSNALPFPFRIIQEWRKRLLRTR